ncbi:T9SS type A sorting domain-containing protein [Ekhidna sp.]
MKTLILTFTLVFYLSTNVAISQQLERQVIASSGSSSTNSFTIGEVMVSSRNLQVTPGFHQGDVAVDTPLRAVDITNELTVFPVPTQDVLTVKGIDFDSEGTNASLFSADGRRLNIKVESGLNRMIIDLRSLPAGNYYLKLDNSINQTFASYKILKIN